MLSDTLVRGRRLDDVLAEIVQRILSVRAPERVILFGSYARGEAGPDSDPDLLVVLRGAERPRRESVVIGEAMRGLGIPVEVIVASPEDVDRYGDSLGLVYRPALQEGVVIYERTAA